MSYPSTIRSGDLAPTRTGPASGRQGAKGLIQGSPDGHGSFRATPSRRGSLMISVHNIFICKPGNAGKLAKLFKEWADLKKDRKMSVMTDMTGRYHRVIIAEQHASLAAYEEAEKEMGQSAEEKALMEKFKDMNEMYVSGSREIFRSGDRRSTPGSSEEAGSTRLRSARRAASIAAMSLVGQRSVRYIQSGPR